MPVLIITSLIAAVIITAACTRYFRLKNRCSQVVECRLLMFDEKIHAGANARDTVSAAGYWNDQKRRAREEMYNEQRHRSPVEYSPVYSYTVNGKAYKIRNNVFTSSRRGNIGSIIPCFIDPEQPAVRFIPDKEKKRLAITIALASSLPALLLLSLLFLYAPV